MKNGDTNTSIGNGALQSNTTGATNTAVGNGALYTQSFSNGGAAWNSDNVAIGYRALYANQPQDTITGIRNVAIGNLAPEFPN
jgi:hypothetical protein